MLLIFILSSCGHKSAPASLSVPEIIPYETAAEETEPVNSALDTYDYAINCLKLKNSFVQIFNLDITFNDNGNIMREYSCKTTEFYDLLSDNTYVNVTTVYDLNGTQTLATESFSNNTVTYEFPGEFSDIFTENISKDDFLKKHDPYMGLRKNRYSSVTRADDGRILFENADSFEKWVVPDGYSMIDADAVVYLDAEKCIQKIEYTATAVKGSVTVDVKAEIMYEAR